MFVFGCSIEVSIATIDEFASAVGNKMIVKGDLYEVSQGMLSLLTVEKFISAKLCT